MEENRDKETLDNDKIGIQNKHLPFINPTVKQSQQNGNKDGEPEDRHVLRQSGVFAFLR